MATLEEARKVLMDLSEADRLALTEELFDSLRTPEERQIADEWDELAAQRMAEIEAGSVETVPVEESIERARARLNDARRVTSRR